MSIETVIHLSPVKICVAAGAVMCALLIGFNAFYTHQEAPLEVVVMSSQESLEVSAVRGLENGKVNINTADADILEKYLDGIGATIAKRIVEYRTQNGNFETVDDLKNVKGIGEATFEKLKDKICV